MSGPVVVKLGGSLMQSPRLSPLLNRCAEGGRGRVVIVPGGGVFADAVRRLQAETGFDDLSAHRLALLAMVQYGHLLMALQPGLRPARTVAEVRAVLRSGRTPVWLPWRLIEDQTGVPADWDWSSDSIGLWLAEQLDAELWLVKSVAPEAAEYAAAELCRRGIVDRAFPMLLRHSRCRARWLGAEQTAEFPDVAAAALISWRPEDARLDHQPA